MPNLQKAKKILKAVEELDREQAMAVLLMIIPAKEQKLRRSFFKGVSYEEKDIKAALKFALYVLSELGQPIDGLLSQKPPPPEFQPIDDDLIDLALKFQFSGFSHYLEQLRKDSIAAIVFDDPIAHALLSTDFSLSTFSLKNADEAVKKILSDRKQQEARWVGTNALVEMDGQHMYAAREVYNCNIALVEFDLQDGSKKSYFLHLNPNRFLFPSQLIDLNGYSISLNEVKIKNGENQQLIDYNELINNEKKNVTQIKIRLFSGSVSLDDPEEVKRLTEQCQKQDIPVQLDIIRVPSGKWSYEFAYDSAKDEATILRHKTRSQSDYLHYPAVFLSQEKRLVKGLLTKSNNPYIKCYEAGKAGNKQQALQAALKLYISDREKWLERILPFRGLGWKLFFSPDTTKKNVQFASSLINDMENLNNHLTTATISNGQLKELLTYYSNDEAKDFAENLNEEDGQKKTP